MRKFIISFVVFLFFLFFFLFIVIGFYFFWFHYRPSEIRKECLVYAVEKYKERFKQYDANEKTTGDVLNDGWLPRSRIEAFRESRVIYYTDCLKSEGVSERQK